MGGGPEKEALQTLRIIEASLRACGACLDHVTMVHVSRRGVGRCRSQARSLSLSLSGGKSRSDGTGFHEA